MEEMMYIIGWLFGALVIVVVVFLICALVIGLSPGWSFLIGVFVGVIANLFLQAMD